jgi:hypothetical protein
MNQSALIIFLIAQILVTGFTVYFFYKVLFSSKPPVDHDDDGVKTYDAT